MKEKLRVRILIASKICNSGNSQDLTEAVTLLIRNDMGKISKSTWSFPLKGTEKQVIFVGIIHKITIDRRMWRSFLSLCLWSDLNAQIFEKMLSKEQSNLRLKFIDEWLRFVYLWLHKCVSLHLISRVTDLIAIQCERLPSRC